MICLHRDRLTCLDEEQVLTAKADASGKLRIRQAIVFEMFGEAERR